MIKRHRYRFFWTGEFCNCLYLLLCLVSSLFSKPIEEHFRKIENKGEQSLMKGIDFIYMINLDERPEKFKRSSTLLSFYGIFPYRFSAVNGWKLPLEVILDVGIAYSPGMADGFGTYYFFDESVGEQVSDGRLWEAEANYLSHCMRRGMVGIALSHLSILQDAYDSGYQVIWVMEDDIDIIRDPRELPSLIDRLEALVGQDGWDILFTDRDTKNTEGVRVECKSFAPRPNFTPQSPERFSAQEMVGTEFRKVGARYGTYSMLIHRSGMEKLLKFIKTYRLYFPFDLEYTLPDDIRLYTVLDDVVSTQPDAPSDNGFENYERTHD